MTFDRKPGTKSLTLMLGNPGAGCTLVQLDSTGAVVLTTPISRQLVTVPLEANTSRVKLLGPCTVYEIISNK